MFIVQNVEVKRWKNYSRSLDSLAQVIMVKKAVQGVPVLVASARPVPVVNK